MRPYNIQENSLQDDQLEQTNRFDPTQRYKNNHNSTSSSSQNIISQLKTCSQKGILMIIVVLICLLLIVPSLLGTRSKSLQSKLVTDSLPIDKLLKNVFSSGTTNNDQLQIIKVANQHNITRTQIQNAIRFTEIISAFGVNKQQQVKNIQQLSRLQFSIYDQTYNLHNYNFNPITFCILLPSIEQNTNDKSLGTLKSIIAQNYTHYKIVYAKNDQQTSHKLQQYLQEQSFPTERLVKIQNATSNSLQNCYYGIKQHCSSGEVVVLVTKEVEFIGASVFGLYNAVYQERKALALYSEFLKINRRQQSVELGDFKDMRLHYGKAKSFKNVDFHNLFPLVTFYTDVFLSIPIQSLTDQEQRFYTSSWETALMKSIFQLSATRTAYLNELTYYINAVEVQINAKQSIQQIKQFQKVSNVQTLKPLEVIEFITLGKSVTAKQQNNAQTIIKSTEQSKDTKKDEIVKPSTPQQDIIQQAQLIQTKHQQTVQTDSDILSNQNNQQQLKDPVLAVQENQRDPLESPTIDKPQSKATQQNQQTQKNNAHRPLQQTDPTKKLNDKSTEQVIIDGKISIKSKEVLPIDEIGGFLQIQDQEMQQIKTPNPQKKSIKKPFNLPGRMDVKGPIYTFNVSIQDMINSADLQKTFGKRKSKQGIWKTQLFQSIQKLQITNNVKYGGEVQVEMTSFDNDKFQKIKRVQQLIQSETEYLQANYKISEYKKKQLPFCIIVPSFDNVQSGLYLRNLNSIFMQNYNNYHVVYIDDGSTDKTGQYVKSYIMSRSIPLEKIEIITNKENRKPPYNIYNAITNHCKLGELALIVQGDDALIGTNVLNLYNAIYQRDKCAMIYSSYLEIFDNSKVQLGVGHQIMDEYFQKKTIRSIFEIPGRYLLSFYVDVFKSIRVEQFKDPKGYFFWFAYDRALITPLLQISYPRINIVKEILYEHRRDTGKKQYPNDWNRQSGQILAKKPYKPLKFFPFIERNKYKYFIDGPIEKVIENSDFEAYTFINNFEKEGIAKEIHQRAIKLTQIIHNVNNNGQIVVELAEYQNSKQEKQLRIQKLLEQDKKYLNEKYRIDFYRNEELPFCIITPSYNNVKSGLYLRNLDSVFMQDYKNYHVVYIDDCSPDKTGEFVKKYLEEKNIPKNHIEVIINKENKKALYNIHLGIHKYCKSGEIVAIIDGDDSFIGRNILALFNAVYQRDKAAMAYSNFLTIHNNDRTELGFCHDIDKEMFEQNTFRNSWDLPGTHLMTFYSDLFKKIKISDLTYSNGTFFDYAYDRAILTPLLEMAYPRISVVKEITYEYRNDTGINDAPDDWIRVSHMILGMKPYTHLGDFPFIKGLIVSTDKFNIKAEIQTVIKSTDFSVYQKSKNKKITGIAKEQHIHAIRLTELVHNINFEGRVDISLKNNKNIEKKKQRLQKLLKNDKEYLQTKYNISKYKDKELPFCIVVSSFKSLQNGLYLRNLDSILMQDYKNYRIIYIDDNSPSESQEYLKKYLQQEHIPPNVLTIIRNQQTLKDLSNIYYAAHNECQLNEIMVVIGQNDALIGINVLKVLNALYQKQKALIGFSCFLKVFNSSSELGKCTDFSQFYFKTKTFRNHLQFEKYRLMSFYTHLFRRIKIKDLTFENGTFFNNAIDKAIMIPLIEMSYPNVLIVKEIMYEDRYDKESRDMLQQGIETNIILSKEPYHKIGDFELF